MTIYVKAEKKVELINKRTITIKDVCEVVVDDVSIKKTIEDAILLIVQNDKTGTYLLSITDIIKSINKLYPNFTIINLGEKDIFVDYKPKAIKLNKYLQVVKIIFICIVVFSGSGVAIMSFYNDAQVGKVLIQIHKVIFNETVENPLLINISFSVGLFFGMVVFFNHFAGVKITDDPTPIEVEMSLYEKDVTDILIDYLSNESTKEKSNDSNI
jgi:stage V sporulation protein AA